MRHQGWCISTDAMRSGLSRAALPGRVEVIPGNPIVVLDTAHNPASARALVEALAEFQAPARRTLVLSVSHDKDVLAIVRELAPHFDRFIVTQYQENPRAVSAHSLATIVNEQLAQRGLKTTICVTPPQAWQHVSQTACDGELICITGSFYLVAEMRRLVFAKQ
jgi:dihydrofolate synthase/folylpolyglutamate synthase